MASCRLVVVWVPAMPRQIIRSTIFERGIGVYANLERVRPSVQNGFDSAECALRTMQTLDFEHQIRFENLVELWKQYTDRVAQTWASDDPRRELSSEVQNRLVQLDIILDHLKEALRLVLGDPVERRRKGQLFMQAGTKFRTGEMTQEKYNEFLVALSPKSPDQVRSIFRAWNEVILFTEAFYFFAWRLVEVLTGSGAFAFEGFSKLKKKARGIRIVRNHLLQHPEKYGNNSNNGLSSQATGRF